MLLKWGKMFRLKFMKYDNMKLWRKTKKLRF